MILYVIFGQRKCSYEGQYAPEALDVVDEYSDEENPVWLRDCLDHHRGNEELSAVEVVEVDIVDDELFKAMFPDRRIQGGVEPERRDHDRQDRA